MRHLDSKPLVYLITKGDLTAENFREKSFETLAMIEKSVLGGISLIQIREKSVTAGQLFELAANAARLTRSSNTKLLVNDRADIALAAGANGVHLPASALRADIIRRHFPANFTIGVSAHSLAEVARAERGGADFATFSPVFATASKALYGAPQGIAKLRETAQTFPGFPVIALGGIDAENYAECLRAGASGIAAIRFLNEAADLGETVGKIRGHKYE